MKYMRPRILHNPPPHRLESMTDVDWAGNVRRHFPTTHKRVTSLQWDNILSKRFKGDGCAFRAYFAAVRTIRAKGPVPREHFDKVIAGPNIMPKKAKREGKRHLWKGYNACEVIRWLAANAVEIKRIASAVEQLGFSVNPATIKIQMRKGQKDGGPAFSADAVKELRKLGKV